MSKGNTLAKWAKKYPGYMSTSDAERKSGWRQELIQEAANAGVFKDAHRVCEIDSTRPDSKRWLISKQDVENMRWLNKDMHRKPCIADLEIIDELRTQYAASLPITPLTEPRSTAAPKEATAAVVEVRSRSSRINERLWNIAAGFIIAGGIALGFIAFMVVIIGVAALM